MVFYLPKRMDESKGIYLLKYPRINILLIFIFIVSLLLGLILSISPVIYIVIAAIIGIGYQKKGGFKKL